MRKNNGEYLGNSLNASLRNPLISSLWNSLSVSLEHNLWNYLWDSSMGDSLLRSLGGVLLNTLWYCVRRGENVTHEE